MKIALSKTNNTFPQMNNGIESGKLGDIPAGNNYVIISNLDARYNLSMCTFNKSLEPSNVLKITNREPVRLQEEDTHFYLEIDPDSISDPEANIYFDLEFLEV